MEVATDMTWSACSYLDGFFDNLSASSSPLIFEACDSSSPSVNSIETESECDKESFWSHIACSNLPYVETDDWPEDLPLDIVSSFSPCRRDTSCCLDSCDTKIGSISFFSSPFSGVDPPKNEEYGCASGFRTDHSMSDQGVSHDPSSDGKLSALSSSSSGMESDCFEPLILDSEFCLKSGETVRENVPTSCMNTFPDLSKIIVRKPILDKAVEKLGGGKKGAQMLWQIIRLWLSQRNSPVDGQLATDQEQARVATVEQLNGDPNIRAMLEKSFKDGDCISGMEGMPDAEKQVRQWLFQEARGISEATYFKSLSPCLIPENTSSSFQKHEKMDHHIAWGHISSQAARDGAPLAFHGPGPFSGYASEDASTMDVPAHCQGRNGFMLSPLSVEPPPLVSTSVASGLSCAVPSLNSSSGDQMKISKSHLDALQTEASFLNGYLRAPMSPPPPTPAATSRAARKSRMARQRRAMANHYARLTPSSGASVSWSPLLPGSAYRNVALETRTEFSGRSSLLHERKVRNCKQSLKLLLQKELKPSDVGNLGRIVLPKKEAETHLPYLTAREGVSLPMEDMKTSQIWNFRYRFWPNNKSRMYLLESTGNFVKAHCLQEGDTMLLFKDYMAGKYVIGGKKMIHPLAMETGGLDKLKGNVSRQLCNLTGERSCKNEPFTDFVASPDVASYVPPSEAFDCIDTLIEEAITKFPEDTSFGGQDLPYLECLPNLEAVDISIDDFLDLVEDSKRGVNTEDKHFVRK